MAENFDVLVIGAGPAGYVAAIRLAQLGLKTAIVDKQWLGGVCLNIGCIPSKALLRNAEIAHILRERSKEFGFSFDNLNLDYSAAVKRSRQVSDRLVKGIGFLMKKNDITVLLGTAKLTTGTSSLLRTICLTDTEGNNAEVTARNILLATGASALVPDAWKVDGEKVLTYREAILQDKLPRRVIIIGAGAIGMEFATVWNSYGVDVTIVEMLPHVLPLEDEETAAEVSKAFTKRGVKLMVGHKVEAVDVTATGVQVTVSEGSNSKVLDAEQVLVAIGFRPNSKGLGLEDTGVKMSQRGFIEIDEKMATNVPGVWAIGDVTGKLMLAHVGSAMGIVAAENIAGRVTEPLDYEGMPRATYCQPQVASFGLNEAQAKARGYTVKIGRFPFQANGKALGLGDYAGWVKLVVDEKIGKILGASLVGPEVTELLPELTLARMLELTPAEIARNIHAHPTLSEAIMEAAHSAEGSAIHL
jgi:dihydrolipoamide dehydrogenase